MKINTKLNYDYISLENIEFDFSKYGVYIISGKNGTGKSTIMKHLIFEQNEVTCNSREQQDSYENSRADLISYVGQDPDTYSCSVLEYVFKFSQTENLEMFEEYKEIFEMSHIDNRQNVNQLSGGERMKLCLIGAILKNTPYIFLDEPTNNLDNPSVRILIEVLEKLAKERSIIIISHDPRLEIANSEKIMITDTVEVVETMEGEDNQSCVSKVKFPTLKTAFSILRSPLIVFTCLLMLVLLNFYGYFSNMLYERFISGEIIREESRDVIVSYKVDQEFGELNQGYAKHEKLSIDANKQYQMIYFKNIAEIAQMDDVEKVILSDNQYIDELAEDFYNEKLLDSTHKIAVPNELIKFYGGQLLLPFDIRNLVSGRLPYDGQNEVVVSLNYLEKYFGITDEDPIGMSVNIEGTEYEIVGIGYFDICIVSYEEDTDLGYFTYKGQESEEMFGKIETCLKEKDFYITDASQNVIVYTKQGKEEKVLNELLQNYPAENYISYEFQKNYKDFINTRGTLVLYGFCILYSLIMTIFTFFMFRRIVKLNMVKIEAFNNYYCDKTRMLRLVKRCLALGYIVCFVVGAVFTAVNFGAIFRYFGICLLFFAAAWVSRRKYESF